MPITIKIDPSATKHVVSRYIHGHFVEFLGSCIDDGVWVGPHSPIPNEDGLRLDTLEALRKLNVPVIRWPGGLYADNYHWRDGIGPREIRPVRQNLGWNCLENNQFGLHEFMRFCRLLEAEPYLCCNLGTGTVEEARSWAEYCNCAKDTTLARERAANGDPEPFDVKFWGLGNEVGYVLDGAMTPQYYADRARHFAGYVKLTAAQCMFGSEEPFKRIKTVLALTDSWLEPFAEAVGAPGAWANFDLLSVHLFTGRYHEDPVQEFKMLLADLRGFENKLKTYSEFCERMSNEGHSVDIAVDEWANWRIETSHYNGLQGPCKLADALWAAGIFHLFYQHPRVHMANVAQTLNVLTAPIYTDGEKFMLTPVYHMYDLLKAHGGQTYVPAELTGATTIKVPEGPPRDALSVTCTLREDAAELQVSLINFDTAEAAEVCVDVADEQIWRIDSIRQLTGPGVDAVNTFDKPEHIKVEVVGTGTGDPLSLMLPPASLTSVKLVRG